MKRCRWFAMSLLLFGILAADTLPQEKQKPDTFTEADKAGPDFLIQGEYVGEGPEKVKLGAEVVAKGNGNFLVNLLPGGLRGEGGDYTKRLTGAAKTEDGKVTVTGKDKWSASIANGKMTGKAEDQSFTLSRVIRKSPTIGAKPPEGAIVLFDGTSAAEWGGGKLVEENLLRMGVNSKKTFKDIKLHIEFRTPFMPKAGGQGRGNSGVYFQGRYEVQVLDSFGLEGKGDECGAVYGVKPPTINMCYPPLSWQTYDVEYRAARFDPDGKAIAKATITVLHNGVKVHDNLEIKSSGGKGEEKPGPIQLQDHGNPVYYRNIWVLPLDEKK